MEGRKRLEKTAFVRISDVTFFSKLGSYEE
jgi:hypothetical protein